MSYEPTVWKDGDLVTSAKLNKLEQGVANGVTNGVNFEIINMELSDQGKPSLDKTAGEIIDILKSGKHILVIFTPEPSSDSGMPPETYVYYSAIPTQVGYIPGSYFQMALHLPMFATNSDGMVDLTASSLDQYPSFNR